MMELEYKPIKIDKIGKMWRGETIVTANGMELEYAHSAHSREELFEKMKKFLGVKELELKDEA